MRAPRRSSGVTMRAAVMVFIVSGVAACTGASVDEPLLAVPGPAVQALTAPAAYPNNPNKDSLVAFFEALKSLEARTTEHVTILQIGDSHTAGDVLSGELRTLMQERFGNAGRGMMQAGTPFTGARPKDVTITQTGSWKVSNSLTAPNDAPYDVTGFVSTSASARASMRMEVVDPGFFDRARIDFLRRPGGGPLEIRVDGERREVISTSGSLDEPDHVTVTVPGARQLQVVALNPGTRISSWSIERFAPGVLLDSFGVVSATVGLFDRWDPALVRQNFYSLRPSLIIVAYGTNEGFVNNFDATSYANEFASTLARLHHDAPMASILVVGPPLAARTDPRCFKAGNPNNCRWEVPPALYAVREIQQRAAADAGDAFWDWSQVMTRDGGVDAWFRADPALLRPDHIHQTVAGYQRSASSLFSYLMHRYDTFRQSDQGGMRPS
jgi:lysophospholipase L1-like esterase